MERPGAELPQRLAELTAGRVASPIITFVPVERVDSPCVNVCSIDPEDGRCEGCRRTLDEIARWTGMGAAERTRILGELAGR